MVSSGRCRSRPAPTPAVEPCGGWAPVGRSGATVRRGHRSRNAREGRAITDAGRAREITDAARALSLQERVILPQDPDYDTARAVWNGIRDRRPAAIVQAAGVAAIIARAAFRT